MNDLAIAEQSAHEHLTTPARRDLVAAPTATVSVPNQPALMHPNEAAGFLMLGTENWALLKAQATELVEGGALHRSIDTPAKAAMIGMKAIEMGIPLTAAFSGMRFIDGELALLGKLVLRLIYQRALPLGATCRPIPVSDPLVEAAWEMGRPGDEPQTFSFTMEDAKRAGLLRIYSRKKNAWIDTPAYQKYPDRMLPWRALAKGAAYIFQDICQGCLLVEELSHKDPDFLEQQAIEADKNNSSASASPTFADGMPERIELRKGHPRLANLSDLISEHTTLSSQVASLQGHEIGDDWYDDASQHKRKDLCKRCVRGRYPTEGEVRTMEGILGDEIKALKREVTNLTIASQVPEGDDVEGSPAPDDQ